MDRLSEGARSAIAGAVDRHNLSGTCGLAEAEVCCVVVPNLGVPVEPYHKRRRRREGERETEMGAVGSANGAVRAQLGTHSVIILGDLAADDIAVLGYCAMFARTPIWHRLFSLCTK
jgi:hypothetical protein